LNSYFEHGLVAAAWEFHLAEEGGCLREIVDGICESLVLVLELTDRRDLPLTKGALGHTAALASLLTCNY